METSESTINISKALAKAQREIGGAQKNVENTFLKSKYADLKSVWESIRIPLAENDLSVVQLPKTKDNEIELETVLMHSSGERIVSVFSMPLIQKTPQTFGTLLAYLRRYSLSAMVGVYQEDDDGGDPEKQQTLPDYENEASATASLMNSKTLEELESRCLSYKNDYQNGITGWDGAIWNRICGHMKSNKDRFQKDDQKKPDDQNQENGSKKPDF